MKNKKLNILILPREPYPSNRPMLIEFWNKEMKKRGHKIIWLMQSEVPLDKMKIDYWNNSKICLTPATTRNNMWEMIKNILLGLIYKFVIANKIMKKENIDIVHAHDGAYEGVLMVYLTKRYKKNSSFGYTGPFAEESSQHICRGTGFLIKLIRQRFRKLGYNFTFRNANIVFPISKYLCQRLIKEKNILSDKVFPLPECASEYFLKYKTNKNSDSKKIIYHGGLAKSRKMDFLLRVFKIVLNSHPDAKLTLIGWAEKPTDITDLIEYSKKLGIKKSVEFLGKIPYNEIPKYASDANIGISPIVPIHLLLVSTPTKCIEYLSLGIPVVANKEIYDQKELLTKSGGGFAVKYDENEFADSIIWLLKHPEEAKEMGKKGRKWIKKNRTYELLAEKLEKRYYELIEKQKKR